MNKTLRCVVRSVENSALGNIYIRRGGNSDGLLSLYANSSAAAKGMSSMAQVAWSLWPRETVTRGGPVVVATVAGEVVEVVAGGGGTTTMTDEVSAGEVGDSAGGAGGGGEDEEGAGGEDVVGSGAGGGEDVLGTGAGGVATEVEVTATTTTEVTVLTGAWGADEGGGAAEVTAGWTMVMVDAGSTAACGARALQYETKGWNLGSR